MPITPSDQLAAIAEQLQDLELGAPVCHVRERINSALTVRYELPRGVVLERAEHGNPPAIGVEVDHHYREGTVQGVTISVYGTVERGDKRSRGSVEVRWRPFDEYADGEHVRAYWRNVIGSNVPDGARKNIAAAVFAEVVAVMSPELWEILAAETDAARHAAKVRGHIADAVRDIDDARRALGDKVAWR